MRGLMVSPGNRPCLYLACFTTGTTDRLSTVCAGELKFPQRSVRLRILPDTCDSSSAIRISVISHGSFSEITIGLLDLPRGSAKPRARWISEDAIDTLRRVVILNPNFLRDVADVIAGRGVVPLVGAKFRSTKMENDLATIVHLDVLSFFDLSAENAGNTQKLIP